ncbi:hypothetical protein EIA19_21640 [Escherichia coli]|nr:hypothetical protein EIA19_21640 [Escherichia coli]
MMSFLLNAVTNLVLRSGPFAKRWELFLMLPNRRDRQVAARAGILRSLSTEKLINPTISLMMLIVESSSSIFALLLDKAIGLSKACCNRTAKNKCFKSTY